ncbi:O-acetyl-ADP-ribose deacetylase MACROD2-like [Sinocyclocheilus grahami]|uniref:O-acetyl-ADP-ribose deacetylase MACROD2-like n=1 Tax=Sinocyclocheilus grahami TaxID=75366 RepID=UPI0007AC8F3E|nr:PREDICTED: O-acetyl-ADP-ribose deacetylase MACROD2-like [Sinocyclocheilus grahami]
MSKKKKEWRAEKERLLSLGLEDRHKDYRGNYVPLDKIPTWANHDNNTATEEEEQKSFYLADKVSLYKGDITTLEVDAIVNAANSSLLGGGGVDGCIHRAAGHLLYEECHSLNGCETGKAKITCGYDLPAKYVIHTVGPIARGNVGQSQRDDLESCYKYSLKLMKDNNLRSVAFPCISTGIYGKENVYSSSKPFQCRLCTIDRVIFCVFLETDYEIYKRKMSDFFSPDNDDHKNEKDAGVEEGNTEPVEGGEDDDVADKKDEKQDEEMMSQQEESTEDVTMQSQDPEGESPDAESKDEEAKPPEKGEPTVEESPTAKKKVEQESEKETWKQEGKGEDPQVAGEEKGGSPEKKMQTGQPDEAGKQMEESTKSADTGADTSQGPEVPMEVLDADQSVTTAKESDTSNSTKDDVKAQDKSSQEPDATPPDTRPNSEDGQGDKNAQE